MKAQQAPNAGDGIWSQHSWRLPAVQIELTNAQSRRGGIMDHKNHIDNSVKTVFSGDENRLCLPHASKPVVLIGGGRLGCVPGTYSFSNELFTNLLI